MILTFKISEQTPMGFIELKLNSINELREFGYNITDSHSHVINFVIPNGFGLNHNQVGRADKGAIELSNLDGRYKLVLTYSINYLINIILFFLTVIGAFFISWGLIVLGMINFLFFLLSIQITKSKHANLVNRILGNNKVK